MAGIHVVDRGAREIVVFLTGGFGVDEREPSPDQFAAAVDEVDRLEHIEGLDRVIVDMHSVTTIDDDVVRFLRALVDRGEDRGFVVSFADVPASARAVLQAADWPLAH